MTDKRALEQHHGAAGRGPWGAGWASALPTLAPNSHSMDPRKTAALPAFRLLRSRRNEQRSLTVETGRRLCGERAFGSALQDKQSGGNVPARPLRVSI